MIRTLVWGMAGCAAVGAVTLVACGDDDPEATGTGNCAPDLNECPAISAECLALTDNSGRDVFTLRMSQLSATRPAVLVQEAVYNIIGNGVYINQPECNVSGQGTFCWLLQFDTTTGTLTTGGALPKEDPTEGYCFQVDPANNIEPIQIAAPIDGQGNFSAGPIDYLSVPIYLDMTASSMVRLPLYDVTITGQVSADHNCMGQFNADGLRPINNCKPDLEMGVEYFINGGQLEGYIPLEEADGVEVSLLGQSLCVMLSGSPLQWGNGEDYIQCSRDGNGQIEFPGDWCSTTNSEGGCRDAVRLAGGVAASAVTLRTDCPQGSGGGGAGGSTGGGGAGGATGGGGAGGGAGGG